MLLRMRPTATPPAGRQLGTFGLAGAYSFFSFEQEPGGGGKADGGYGRRQARRRVRLPALAGMHR
jgi:hypothetical protein